MGNFFTYEVLAKNKNNEVVMKQFFNTHLESKAFYEMKSDTKDLYHIQHIKKINGIDSEVIREQINN